MAQTRFTLSTKIKPLADELLELTGVDSYSNLLNLLITKYGQHLKQTWYLLPTNTTPLAYKTKNDFGESRLAPEEIETEVFETPDPVITRLAGLLETF